MSIQQEILSQINSFMQDLFGDLLNTTHVTEEHIDLVQERIRDLKKKLKIKKPKTKKIKVEKIRCQGITHKGTQCKNNAKDGEFCHIHQRISSNSQEVDEICNILSNQSLNNNHTSDNSESDDSNASDNELCERLSNTNINDILYDRKISISYLENRMMDMDVN